MRILVAPQELKGSLTAEEAARAMAEGLGAGHTVIAIPLADGGPGTVNAIVGAAHGAFHTAKVQDALGRTIPARFGMVDELAVLEMAAASGISLLARSERDATRTSTFGTGQLISAALSLGCRRLVIGAGGSATNDGGSGALSALGVRFLDRAGEPLEPGGIALGRLARIDASGLDPRLRGMPVTVAADVTSPLLGLQGASHIFGPQKGASPAQVERLERSLAHYARVVADTLGRDHAAEPATGAAGGFAFGMRAFLGATLTSGFEMVSTATRLEDTLRSCDWVLTAEGRFDGQTSSGKGPSRLATLARASGVRIALFAGDVKAGTDGSGFDSVIAVSPGTRPATTAIAFDRMRAAVQRWAANLGSATPG